LKFYICKRCNITVIITYYFEKTQDNFNFMYLNYISENVLQPLWHNRPAKLSNSVKKKQNNAITPFNVIIIIFLMTTGVSFRGA